MLPVRLSEQQTAFVRAVLSEQGKHVLLGPVGTGKATAVRAVISDLSAATNCRVLYVGVPIIGAQFQASAEKLPSLEISRAWLRERRASGSAGWPSQVLAVAPPTTIRDPWALSELAQVPWDLLVIDADAIGEPDVISTLEPLVGGAAQRVVVLTSSPDPVATAADLPGFEVTAWESPFTGWSDEPVEELPGDFHLTVFRRDAHEVDLLNRIRSLADGKFEDAQIREAFASLADSASSSPYAAQAAALALGDRIRDRRNALAHSRSAEEASSSALRVRTLNEASEALAHLELIARSVDDLQRDARNEALLGLIQDLHARDPSPIVVFCKTRATAEYVASSLRLVGLMTSTIVGAEQDEPDARTSMMSPKHVVVALDVAAKGLDFAPARRGVNYDLPRDQRRMHVRWTRLSPGYGPRHFEMWTLWDESTPTAAETRALESMPFLRGRDIAT